MKKVISLLFVALFATVIMAEQKAMPRVLSEDFSVVKRTNTKKMQVNHAVMPYEEILAKKAASKVATDVAADAIDTLYFIRDYGTFFWDALTPAIIVDTFSFYLYSTDFYRHTEDNQYFGIIYEGQYANISEVNAPYIELPYEMTGTEFIPADFSLVMPLMFTTDDEGYIKETFSYASGLTDFIVENIPEYAGYAAQGYFEPEFLSRPSYPVRITTCAMYTDEKLGIFDDYMLGDGMGGYAFGTGIEIGGTIVDTLLVYFDSFSTLEIDSAFLSIYGSSANMIAAGAEVKLEIVEAGFAQTSDGYYYMTHNNNVLATAIATQNDIKDTYTYPDGTVTGTLAFAFGANDILGGFTPTPFTKTGMFAVKIILNNAAGNNFGILSDYWYPDGQSYFLAKGEKYGYPTGNMHLSLNALFVNDGSTAVDNIAVEENNVRKVVRDGQVLIEKGGKTYNMLGAEIK